MPAIKSPPPVTSFPDEVRETTPFDLAQYGITVQDIRRILSPAALYTEASRDDAKCDIADTGALIGCSGERTGRSPKDKRLVEPPHSKEEGWWGAINVPNHEE